MPPKPAAPVSPFVGVEQRGGRYWLVQGGRGFVARGVNVVLPSYDSRLPDGRRYNGLEAHGGDTNAWAAEAAARLRDWGFNTVGAWSDLGVARAGGLYYTLVVPFGPWGHGADMRLMDVFSETYAEHIEEVAAEYVAPRAQDPYLIGYFANNELPFYGHRGWPTDPRVSLLTRYMTLPPGSPSKQRLVEFLREAYAGDFVAFQRDWASRATSFEDLLRCRRLAPRSPRTKRLAAEWAGVVADRYYRLVAEALHRHDTNHLFLGSRFAMRAPGPVVAACGRYADVISLNGYSKSGVFDAAVAGAMAALTGKPIWITEFSWAAMENSSDCPNTTGADVTVATQQDRADRFRQYITVALEQPYVVGYDWFCYADESPDGRFDGEDCNYGLVDIHNRPYEVLLQTIRDLNGRAEALHEAGAAAWPAYDPAILSDSGQIRVAFADEPLPQPVLWATGENAVYSYGDAPRGGVVEVGPAGPRRKLVIRTGRGWGCGVTVGPREPTYPDGSADVRGATALVVRLRANRAFEFAPGFNESGHDAPGQPRYAGYGQADGEAFTHLIVPGHAGAAEYEFALGDLDINPNYGNQRGNRTLDTDALRDVGLYFPGGQGEIEIELESILLK